MSLEENKNKYSHIEYVRTNMLWMDIKIVDPEMENLMKQINEEQKKLKEALREKLFLIKHDIGVVQKENEQLKEWLNFKRIVVEETKDHSDSNGINEIVIKEEIINDVTNADEHCKEKSYAQTSEEFNCVEKSNNKSAQGTADTKEEFKKLKSCYIKLNGKESKEYIRSKELALRKDSQNMNTVIDPCAINNQDRNEESGIATRTRKNTQTNISFESVWLTEKKVKRDMGRRRVVKNYKMTNRRKKNTKRKVDVQNKGDIDNINQP